MYLWSCKVRWTYGILTMMFTPHMIHYLTEMLYVFNINLLPIYEKIIASNPDVNLTVKFFTKISGQHHI